MPLKIGPKVEDDAYEAKDADGRRRSRRKAGRRPDGAVHVVCVKRGDKA